MKRLIKTGPAAVFLMILVCACGREEAGVQDYPAEFDTSPTVADESESSGKPAAEEKTGVVDMEISQTGWTKAVPAAYTQEAAEQGNVVRLDYQSEDYVRGGSTITKTAYGTTNVNTFSGNIYAARISGHQYSASLSGIAYDGTTAVAETISNRITWTP